MHLLVSVRSAAEARLALAGGAAIIDAKDPARGALGAVGPSLLRAILAAVPLGVPVSVAIGDPETPAEAARMVRQARAAGLGERAGVGFVKLGFRRVEEPRRAEGILAAAVEAAHGPRGAVQVIAVAYADARRARSIPLEAFPTLGLRARATGVLLDTAFKDQGGVFDHCSVSRIAALVKETHWGGLLFALAGSLTAPDLEHAAMLGVDVVGVRGAACEGGRTGCLSEARVRGLAQALDRMRRAPAAR